MPPRWRNHREPTGPDTPHATAASSLVKPSAILAQNARSTSRRIGGRPGERIAGRPVNVVIHPACRPINTSAIKVLRRPVESAQYTALRFTQRLVDAGVAPSTGSTGDSFDNALAENLWSTIKVELVYWPGTTFATRAEAEHALIRYIDGWYNPRRIQAGLGGLSPDEYEDAYHRSQHDHPDR